MKRIVLKRKWGRHAAKAELEVLGPHDAITPTSVDAVRAAQLIADGFAVEYVEPPLAEQTKADQGKE